MEFTNNLILWLNHHNLKVEDYINMEAYAKLKQPRPLNLQPLPLPLKKNEETYTKLFLKKIP